MFKIILKYISYFMAIVGAATVIWKFAVYFENRDDDLSITSSQVKEINVKLDSVMNNLQAIHAIKNDISDLKKGQKDMQRSQGVLVNSFAKHLSNDKSVTKDDLLDFMEQFRYEIKKNNEYDLLLIVPKNNNMNSLDKELILAN